MTRRPPSALVCVENWQAMSSFGPKKSKRLGSYGGSDPTECIMEAGDICESSYKFSETGKAFHNHRQPLKPVALDFKICKNGMSPPLETFVSLLRGCIKHKAFWEGSQIHAYLINHGLEDNVLLGNLLISMYTLCECSGDANRLFVKMFARDVFTWTLIITAYTKSGYNEQAMRLFWRMEDEGVRPNKVTFLSIIRACTSLSEVETLFAYIVEEESDFDEFVVSTLLDFYAKHAALDDAYFLFQKVQKSDAAPWNAMIAGFSQQALHNGAFSLLARMLHAVVKPDEVTCLTLLKSCIDQLCLADGQKVHGLSIENGMESSSSVVNSIINMYAKCRSMEDAEHMFNQVKNRDVVTWSVMIAGHTQHGHAEKALLLFKQMLLSGIEPNKVVLMCALKACTALQCMRRGQTIHSCIALLHIEHDPFLGSSLVDMYSKCGSIKDAHFVFKSMPLQDTVMWNSMIDGYTEVGEGREALRVFQYMICEGFRPDEATFVSSLKACVDLADLEQGRQVHGYAIENSMHSHSQVGNALIDLYAKCGCMTEACQAFDKIFDRSWVTALSGNIQNDLSKEGLQLFDQMKLEGATSSAFTFSAVCKAYGSPLNSNEGKQIHVSNLQLKLELNSASHDGSSVVDLCGETACGRQVSNRLPQRDVVSYNTIISACVENELCFEAMNVFCQMLAENIEADSITFVCMMKVSASLSSLEQGMQLHAMSVEGGHDKEDIVRGILVDMYAKCGCMTHAKNIFDCISEQDKMSCTSMVLGYAQHGLGHDAICLLEQMQNGDVELDAITFIGALSACNYGGLVGEGLYCFHRMQHQLCMIMPSSQHYACLVDLLGRAGHLKDTVDLLQRIPCHPTAAMWTTLLAACKLHGAFELENFLFKCIVGLEPGNIRTPVLSNLKAVGCSEEQSCSQNIKSQVCLE
ncbi:hypothetical protein GOP47_0027814 [Adiantum capillus-veneris]|nr:hypothetical protein GOP47_0027135 [Adiantum capillus-veneris]KAI5057799.1 hypothetical protein GOP47_0027814 [Adiantum capillus-veneris]